MSSVDGRGDDRRTVPRWRSFRLTADIGELGSLRRPVHHDVSELSDLKMRFEESRELFVGADYIDALVVHRHRDLPALVTLLQLAQDGEAPESLTQFLRQVHLRWGDAAFGEPTQDHLPHASADLPPALVEAKALVGASRRRLRTYPRDALALVDLALGFATLGERARATRAMRTAVALASDNRFVLRSASRMWVHFDEPDRAHDVVARSPRYRHDPWLLAAEHAAAKLAFDKQVSGNLGREMAASNDFSPRALSELVSELATDEVDRGRDKRARLLFTQALEDPTENAVAQAASVVARSDIRVAPTKLSVSGAFEARSLDFAQSGRWAEARAESLLWFRDESFSVRPVLFGSFVASLCEGNYSLGAQIAADGIKIHPDDPLLHNNAAFALAQLGQLEEARSHVAIASLARDDVDRLVITATEGLIEFRSANFVRGRELYLEAIKGLEKVSRQQIAALASVLYAIEEVRAGVASDLSRITQVARDNVKKFPSPEAVTVLERLNSLRHPTALPGIASRTD